jgi:hypothetical protein
MQAFASECETTILDREPVTPLPHVKAADFDRVQRLADASLVAAHV